MENLLIKLRSPKKAAMVKQILEALDVEFIPTTATKKEVPNYDPALVKKVLQSEKNREKGKVFRAKNVEDIWK